MPDLPLPPPLSRLEPESAEIVRKCMRRELPPELLLDLVAELEDLNRADAATSDAIDRLYHQLTRTPPTGADDLAV